MECVDLVALVERYDLALMDTSFLEGDSSLADKIYGAVTSTDLERLTDELNSNHVHWDWMMKNLLQMKGVATVSGVVKELKQLKNHLKRSHQFCSPRRSNSHLYDDKIPKKRVELDVDQEDIEAIQPKSQPKPTLGLNTLYKFLLQVDRTIKELKEYHPVDNVNRRIHPRRRKISSVDYHLVDAGVDYLRQHPEERVGIFTKDFHIIKILDDYLNQKISLPRGEIAVYRFYPGKVHDGCLLLRKGLVSECAPINNYPLRANSHTAIENVANI